MAMGDATVFIQATGQRWDLVFIEERPRNPRRRDPGHWNHQPPECTCMCCISGPKPSNGMGRLHSVLYPFHDAFTTILVVLSPISGRFMCIRKASTCDNTSRREVIERGDYRMR